MDILEFENLRVILNASLVNVATKETKKKEDGVSDSKEMMPSEEVNTSLEKESVSGEVSPEEKTDVEVPETNETKGEGDAPSEGKLPAEEMPLDGMPPMEGEPIMKDSMTGEAAIMDEMPSLDMENWEDMGKGQEVSANSSPIMQNYGALTGITAGVLALGIIFGIALAKLRIKKGINLYED